MLVPISLNISPVDIFAMDVPQYFEALISEPENVDPIGFVFKANEEFRIREFLNDTVYTDSMLNHIIGPAAIYSLHGEDIDIIRFNQMFFQAVDVPDFHSKLISIQKTMPENETRALFDTLELAYADRLNGSSGVFTFKKSMDRRRAFWSTSTF